MIDTKEIEEAFGADLDDDFSDIGDLDPEDIKEFGSIFGEEV